MLNEYEYEYSQCKLAHGEWRGGGGGRSRFVRGWDCFVRKFVKLLKVEKVFDIISLFCIWHCETALVHFKLIDDVVNGLSRPPRPTRLANKLDERNVNGKRWLKPEPE